MTYDRIIIMCLSDLGMTSLSEIRQMTLTEFYYRLQAFKYNELKKQEDMYKLAFAIRNSKATKNVGTSKKPKEEWQFKEIKDVFDYEKYRKRLDAGLPLNVDEPETNPSQTSMPTPQDMAELAKRLNEQAKTKED